MSSVEPARPAVLPFAELRRADIAVAGGKGAGLGELTRAGLPVPPGFVVGTGAYREFVHSTGIGTQILARAAQPGEAAAADIRALFAAHELPAALAAEIVQAWRELGQEPVAVRSSATAEDLEAASFAGQQDTYLGVRGPDALLTAVRDCWASLWTARALDYRARRGIDPADVALAVVVQRMVDADAAGVMFTADPTTGRRDRTVISAAWGLGESVVGGTVTTDDVVVDTTTGRVVSRRVADKAVMTVLTPTGTAKQPVAPERRRAPVLDDEAALELARLGQHIERHYGAAQDIEWVRAKGAFSIVQARPVTALPEPTADAPTDWTVPYPGGVYFRASIVEQLPDPLSPLFADMAAVSVPRSLRALMDQAFGEHALRDDDVGFPTVNGYGYYYYRTRGFLRMLASAPVAVGKLARGDAHMGVAGWRDHSHPRYAEKVASWSGREVTELPAADLLRGVAELLDAGCVYYTAVQSVVPVAALTEMGFRTAYERLARRPGDPPALTFLLGFDSQPIRAEKSLHALATWARERPDLSEQLRRGEPPTDPEWQARFAEHLRRYGHVVFNLDFASPVPVDDPRPLLDALRMHVDGHGGNPYQRQQRSADQREAATAALMERLDPVRRRVLGRLLHAAQTAVPAREDALADIGLAWPTMRRMLLELGRRLTSTEVLEAPEEVFWLRQTELEAAAYGATTPLHRTVLQRRAVWRGQRQAHAPQMLPVAPAWVQRATRWAMPAGDQAQSGPVIHGVGASAGTVTAPARVLAGPEDFARMQPGDVLVARMTTPAWTTLFAMASAVVTDVGGPLSHSSIVAREYGIPAVLGTGVATRSLTDGRLVRVDGDAGTVTALDEPSETSADEAEPPTQPCTGARTSRSTGRTVALLAAVGLAALALSALRRRFRTGQPGQR